MATTTSQSTGMATPTSPYYRDGHPSPDVGLDRQLNPQVRQDGQQFHL